MKTLEQVQSILTPLHVGTRIILNGRSYVRTQVGRFAYWIDIQSGAAQTTNQLCELSPFKNFVNNNRLDVFERNEAHKIDENDVEIPRNTHKML